MSNFNPPIEKRKTEDLIIIANDASDEWQQEAKNEAKNELNRRNITQEYQQKVIEERKKAESEYKIIIQKQREKNASKGYSIISMLGILFAAPFILLGSLRVGLSLWKLKEDNFKKKFRQRILLLTGGIVLWVFYINYEAIESEKKRQEEINKVDISEWRKSYFGNDTLKVKQVKK